MCLPRGLLTDQRAALAIYKKIVLRQLDPGILHYVNDNLLELRVFPFWPDESRKTGFELIHKNKFELEIDDCKISIDGDEGFSGLQLSNAVFLSHEEIKNLPAVNKEFDYHFILDCSEKSDVKGLSKIIDRYCAKYRIKDGTLYLATYRFDKYSVKDINKIEVKQDGGFNLNLAVKDILKNADHDKIPIIIFVTNNEDDKIIYPKQMENYASPESEFYYRLDYYTGLTPYSMFTNFKLDTVYEPIIKNVVSYNGKSVINDGTDKLVILNETIPETANNQYLDAIALAAENRINMKNGVKNPLSYIRKSFLSHVLTPATAFIVVETKEQEEDLLALQEKILKEQELKESSNLSEPHFGIIVILICLYLFITKMMIFVQTDVKIKLIQHE